MDKQYLIRDDHIGVFKNFMSNELIENYLNFFINVNNKVQYIQEKKMKR